MAAAPQVFACGGFLAAVLRPFVADSGRLLDRRRAPPRREDGTDVPLGAYFGWFGAAATDQVR
jgi:hypothetical protein